MAMLGAKPKHFFLLKTTNYQTKVRQSIRTNDESAMRSGRIPAHLHLLGIEADRGGLGNTLTISAT